jgi:HSP20 family protein
MNSLATWNPLREFDDLGHRFSRLFGQLPLSFRPAARDGEGGGEKLALTNWSPAVDIKENGKSYTIKADMPEVKKEDLKVTVKNGILELSGERKSEKEERDEKHHRIERSYGRFVRTFTLPEDADATGIQAQCRDGVLTVTLPKSEKAISKEIAVKVD